MTLVPWNRSQKGTALAQVKDLITQYADRQQLGAPVRIAFRSNNLEAWCNCLAYAVMSPHGDAVFMLCDGPAAGHFLDLATRGFQFAKISHCPSADMSPYFDSFRDFTALTQELLDDAMAIAADSIDLVAGTNAAIVDMTTHAVENVTTLHREAQEAADRRLQQFEVQMARERESVNLERAALLQQRSKLDKQFDDLRSEILDARRAHKTRDDDLAKRSFELEARAKSIERAAITERQQLQAALHADRLEYEESLANAERVEAEAQARMHALTVQENELRATRTALAAQERDMEARNTENLQDLERRRRALEHERRDLEAAQRQSAHELSRRGVEQAAIQERLDVAFADVEQQRRDLSSERHELVRAKQSVSARRARHEIEVDTAFRDLDAEENRLRLAAADLERQRREVSATRRDIALQQSSTRLRVDEPQRAVQNPFAPSFDRVLSALEATTRRLDALESRLDQSSPAARGTQRANPLAVPPGGQHHIDVDAFSDDDVDVMQVVPNDATAIEPVTHDRHIAPTDAEDNDSCTAAMLRHRKHEQQIEFRRRCTGAYTGTAMSAEAFNAQWHDRLRTKPQTPEFVDPIIDRTLEMLRISHKLASHQHQSPTVAYAAHTMLRLCIENAAHVQLQIDRVPEKGHKVLDATLQAAYHSNRGGIKAFVSLDQAISKAKDAQPPSTKQSGTRGQRGGRGRWHPSQRAPSAPSAVASDSDSEASTSSRSPRRKNRN